MTPLHWLWLIGGLPLGIAAAVASKRLGMGDEDDPVFGGFIALSVWAMAPAVLGFGGLVLVCVAFNKLVNRVDRRVPPSRRQLLERNAELERELGLDKERS